MHQSVLVVEDDAALAQLLLEELETLGLEVTTAGSLGEARRCLREHVPSLLVTDLRLPDGHGTDLLDSPGEPRPGVMVITAFGDVQQAVAALKHGADDFLTKPLDFDHFILSARRILETHSMRTRLQDLTLESDYQGLCGRSRAMRQLYEQIELMAQGQGAVLITGESGTGKELVARALHAASPRAAAPFLAVNCAGVPAELLESEFFGHKAGAFTGAGKARRGLLLEAHGGSLLLDEIAEMPLPLQAKLLRALQDGRIRPLGQEREEQVDVRIIAATHRDLRERVAEGAFREDLYYRLETFTLSVPPLREREEDIEMLAMHFLRRQAARLQRPVRGLSEAALQRLQRYAFPGNVRELENAMERAVTFCPGERVEVEHLPRRMRDGGHQAQGAGDDAALRAELLQGPMLPTLEELQRRYVHHVLRQVGGNKRRAAALLGIGRRTLYRWLDQGDAAEADEKNW